MDGSAETAERALVREAMAGGDGAFRELVRPRLPELHAHCYRMLGSVQDADDALQEVLLRCWRGLPRFEGRSSLRGWLFRIATNTCLTMIERRPKRVLPVDFGPPVEPPDGLAEPIAESTWVQPYPDRRLGEAVDRAALPEARYELLESVELAFVTALQHLPANPRAVLILREVLGFSAREVAESLGTTPASVNSALQRARRFVAERVPEPSQQATLRAIGDTQLHRTVERYVRALESRDVDAMVALLTEDATWSMPPTPSWYRGREAIIGFLRDGPFHERWRHLPTRMNGQPAVGCYTWDDSAGHYLARVIDVLTLRGQQIAAVTAFLDPQAFGRAGLPDRLPAR